ncbi:uncharacterized protein LOC133499329 [Syngnathoides biaculeatus]|uniref:uncharacterized protein LOC133499329 n=1 Tax=Syngnathoides biaculeatus TaxID=300417 RepID=UPI002ADE0D8A|nr:uncharacterized protein LOC133499329 [Syngnathoides biaculeatus]
MDATPVANSDNVTLTWGDKIAGKCTYEINTSTYSTNSSAAVEFHYSSWNETHHERYMKTCPDCLLLFENVTTKGPDSKPIQGRFFIILTKSGRLDDAHLEVFKKQAACLDFKEELHFGERTGKMLPFRSRLEPITFDLSGLPLSSRSVPGSPSREPTIKPRFQADGTEAIGFVLSVNVDVHQINERKTDFAFVAVARRFGWCNHFEQFVTLLDLHLSTIITTTFCTRFQVSGPWTGASQGKYFWMTPILRGSDPKGHKLWSPHSTLGCRVHVFVFIHPFSLALILTRVAGSACRPIAGRMETNSRTHNHT